MTLAVRWHKLLKGGERVINDKIIKTYGLLDEFPLNTLNGKLIVCATPNPDEHLFNAYQSHLDFIMVNRLMEPQNKHFYEIIFGEWCQKPHFDLDFMLDDGYYKAIMPDGNIIQYQSNQIIEILINAILTVLAEVQVVIDLEKDILIYSSHSTEKQSYHLIINNWYHKSNLEARGFYDSVVSKIPCELNNGKLIDSSVYSKTQQFRILESTKIGKNRPKILNESFVYQGKTITHKYPVEIYTLPDEQREKQLYLCRMEESLITNVWNCNILPEFVKAEKIIRNTTTTLQFQLTPQIATFALNKLPDGNAYKITKINDGLIVLQRNRPSNCIICNRIHENENPYLRINNNGQIYFLCRRATTSVWIGHLPLGILDNLKLEEGQLVAENMINTGLIEFKAEIGENGVPNLKVELNYLKEKNQIIEHKNIWETNVNPKDLLSLKINKYDLEPTVTNINKECEAGHLDLVKVLYKKKAIPTSSGMDKACKNGHLEVVKYLHSIGIVPTEMGLDDSCSEGHLNILKFLIEIGLKATEFHINIASEGGNIEIVRYLCEIGVIPTRSALNRACENANLELVKFLLGLGITPNSTTLEFAISGGYLGIIIALVEAGIMPDESIIKKAESCGVREIFDYLMRLGSTNN